MQPNNTSLFAGKRFLPYFCTQFLGAFNDNVYKNALIILFTYHLVNKDSGVLVNVAAGIFILPFFLFSSFAGQIADKYEKSFLIRRIKQAEIIIMLLGSIAIAMKSVVFMLFVLFLLGAQSTFFGPIKYSILPQHLPSGELLKGNAFVETGTFLAILLGTIAGGLLAALSSPLLPIVSTVLFAAILGWLCSTRIPKAVAPQPKLKVSWNLWSSSVEIIKASKDYKPVFLSILGISWFWFFGAMFLAQFPAYAKDVLYGDERVATLLLAMFSVGIGLGSMACSWLSGKRVEIGLVPIGSLGMTLATLHLAFAVVPEGNELRGITEMMAVSGSWRVMMDLILIAFFAGLYIVPLYAFVQTRSKEENRSRIFAATNLMNSFFMVMAAVIAIICLKLGMTVVQIFMVAAMLNLLVAVYIFAKVPEFSMRLISWLLIHSIYRIGKQDLHHIPNKGAALLVCNHISYVDAVILGSICPRPVRFVMTDSIYKLPVVNFIFRTAKAIPVATGRKNRELLIEAYDKIAEALENGELVCIFPEGGLTADGEMHSFKPGIDKIIARTPVPVVPLALKGLWGTWFSRYGGRAMKGWPKSFMKKISLVSGEPVAPEKASREFMYQQVLELRGAEK